MKQDESIDEEIRPSAFFSVGNISCERDAKDSYKKITSFSPTIFRLFCFCSWKMKACSCDFVMNSAALYTFYLAF